MARILLAESDRRIREFVAGILSDCGHAVEVCANGVEATASLGMIDVVVTDLVLSSDRGAYSDRIARISGSRPSP